MQGPTASQANVAGARVQAVGGPADQVAASAAEEAAATQASAAEEAAATQASAAEEAAATQATTAQDAAAPDEVAGVTAGGPEVAGVQTQGVAGPSDLAGAIAAALPATGQPVGVIGLGFLALAVAGAAIRRRRSR